MSSDQARELRQQGIAAAKAGRKEEARQLLQQSLRIDPTSEPGWMWLASVARDNRERLFCLQKLLEINPNNEQALKAIAQAQGSADAPPAESSGLRKLGSPPAAAPAAPTPEVSARAQDIMSQPPGVPMPSPDSIAEAQKQAENVVREYLQPLPKSVNWVHKTKRRAGEGDVVVLRLYVAGAVAGLLILLLVVGTIVVLSNDDLRALVIAPTPTATLTPTVTPTWTPGETPTPSPTPRIQATPSPTVPLNIEAANPFALPEPTDIYPPVLEVILRDSISLIDRGDYEAALPTLDAERELTENRFQPNPYYFEAIALARSGDGQAALDTLEEAEERLEEAPNERQYPALINSGYAEVYWELAQQALERGDTVDAEDYLTQVEERAQAALEIDPRLDEPYIYLARVYARNRDYREALAILDQGLELADLASNVRLILEKGAVYFAQREYDLAEYQAFLALYIDPTNEAAYELQIATALRDDRPGQAVLYAQNYLFYYPGSTRAFRLLGDARMAEGNYDLALAAYNQGLSGDENPYTVETLVARAQLFNLQKRFNNALTDLTRAFNLSQDQQIQALRMETAFNAGRFSDALEDADELLGRGVVPDAQINLLRARVQIEQATYDDVDDSAPFTEALGILVPLLSDPDLPPEALPIVNEYAARANLALGNEDAALAAISLAMAADETVERHYWRGRIYQAQNELQEAERDYEWVLTWAQIYPVDPLVLTDAQDRYEALSG